MQGALRRLAPNPIQVRSSRGNSAAMSLTISGPVLLSLPCGFVYCLYSRYAIALNLQLSIGILLADQHPVRLFAGSLAQSVHRTGTAPALSGDRDTRSWPPGRDKRLPALHCDRRYLPTGVSSRPGCDMP